MIGIFPISSKLPFITVEVLHNHRLMVSVRIEMGTLVVMLVPSNVEDPFNTCSVR
jgi:hypothetical protein